MSDFEVIATLNEHLLDRTMLREFVAHGATIFRMNGAHVAPADIPRYVQVIRDEVGDRVRLLIDLPGNKIRTVLAKPIEFQAGETTLLRADQFNHLGFTDALRIDDVLIANDGLLRFHVVGKDAAGVRVVSEISGVLPNGKGVHLPGRDPELPFLFARDRELIRRGVESGLDYLGLSFVRRPEEVDEARALVAEIAGVRRQPRLMVKIETGPAVQRLDAILSRGEEFLVDRGDLSSDIGLENVDRIQKLVLRRAHELGRRVYFATQFLTSMLDHNIPLIAEACALSDAIRCGVDGVQLSEETAVGKYPLQALGMVQAMRRSVRPKFRAASPDATPILWFTGPVGADLRALASSAAASVESLGFRCCVIDGEHVRQLWQDALPSDVELRAVVFASAQAAKDHDLVLVVAESDRAGDRAQARERLPGFCEVFLESVGGSTAYEAPVAPELVIGRQHTTCAERLSALESWLFAKP